MRNAPGVASSSYLHQSPISIAPSTVMRWVIRYAGAWTYLYRAVDQNSKTVDFFLSKQRDVRAAKSLFRHALKKHGDPLSIKESAILSQAIESRLTNNVLGR